jgi:CDP-glucose 4,6-dehydratase
VRLAEQLWHQPTLAGAYNFGPQTHEAATVREVIELAQSAYGSGTVRWGDGTEGPHEAGWLALEIAKARTLLGVEPRWSLAQTVEHTLKWYRRQAQGESACDLCHADITAFAAESARA